MKSMLVITTVARTHTAFLTPYAEVARSQGWVVDAAASSFEEAGDLDEVYNDVHSIPWDRTGKSVIKYIKALYLLRSIVIRNKYSIVHTHTPIASFLSRLAIATIPKRKRPIVIYTAHGFHFHQYGKKANNTVFFAVEKLLSRFTDYIITMNQDDFAAARKFNYIPEDRVINMPGIGISLDQYNAKSRNIPDSTRLPFKFVVVAEFIPRKRQIIILKAAKICANAGLNFTISFIGDGPLLKEMEAYADLEKLSSFCLFVGFKQNVAEELSNSNALILASNQEGMPRCVLEAMASGVPVIGSAIRGTRDLLTDGAGLLFEVDNPGDLAEKMIQLMHDADLASIISVKALEKIQDYSLNNTIKYYLQLLSIASQR
ncbi:glycosyltransferase family 4 protein [Deinococcus sp. KSM4-11]|uniref:glycosyltransferase family 4 protein n=1 Tax=Deinococcus sp. KSM4-11 TaxID=2568654 RepID=UPI0010A30B53|nr:glycosyltransferase family 4 protein [Deinococcus sp. KSM4-11]THF87140.1 glycosyltransferase family 4 protein [Deinococcus sp. KSM4-11]